MTIFIIAKITQLAFLVMCFVLVRHNKKLVDQYKQIIEDKDRLIMSLHREIWEKDCNLSHLPEKKAKVREYYGGFQITIGDYVIRQYHATDKYNKEDIRYAAQDLCDDLNKKI